MVCCIRIEKLDEVTLHRNMFILQKVLYLLYKRSSRLQREVQYVRKKHRDDEEIIG